MCHRVFFSVVYKGQNLANEKLNNFPLLLKSLKIIIKKKKIVKVSFHFWFKHDLNVPATER